MKRNTKAVQDELNTLAEEARLLVTATAGIAEQGVTEARDRLAAALKRRQGILGRFQNTASRSVRAADSSIRHHPYRTLTAAFGLGALFGLLVLRRT